MLGSVARFAGIAIALLVLSSARAWAQTPTGEITGTVTDPSGAVVADATVTLTNPATNAVRTTKTNSTGIYDLPALPPGTYTLKVEMQGFNAELRSGIELQVAQVARFDTTLKVGNVSNTIEVAGGAPVLETESTSVGTVIENQRIVELPLNGRNYLSLTALTPGVTNNSQPNQVASSRQGGLRGSFTVSAGGQRAYFNHYALDGAENTDPNFNAFLFLPSLDALQEFKVETGIFPAEYGHNMTQVNVTTKSGTNALHGSLFEFIRNSAVDAKNYFDKSTAPIPPFKRNQFGGTLGGPIVKNRLFYFFDYEGLRERKALTKVSTVPTQNEVNGNFQGLTTIYNPSTRVYSFTNGIPSGVISVQPFLDNMVPVDPVSKAFFSQYVPLPNVGGVNNGVANNYVTALTQPTDSDQEAARVDFIQSSASTWFARYAHTREYQAVPGSFANEGLINNVHAHQGVIGNTFLVGPNKVNDFRIDINYLNNLLPGFNAGKVNVVKNLGINYPTPNPFYWGVPSASATGFTLGGEGAGDWANWDGFGQVADNFSWIVGKHTFKFGGAFGRTRFNGINGTYSSGIYNATGQYTTNGLTGPTSANALADLLLGNFGVTSGLFGTQIFNLRWNYLATYFEDSWKVTPKLTINYGLRWEDQTPPVDHNDAIVNVIFRWDSSIAPYFCRSGNGDPNAGSQGFSPPPGIAFVRNGTCNSEFNNDPFNFGPRLGMAYSLNSKTVIRAGAGFFYAHDIGNGFIESNRNIPFSLIQKPTGNPVQPNLTWQSLFPPPPLPSFSSAIERNEPTSRVYEWNLAVQRELYPNASLEVDYVGSAGAYLPRISSYDTARPGPGSQTAREPFPQFGGGIQVVHSTVHSSYHALQARFEQRFSHGFTVLSSLSYAKSIDNGSSLRPIPVDGDTRDPNNPSDVRALSSFDFRRRWATSFLYELPFGRGKALLDNSNRVLDAVVGGWQLGGIFTMQDGMPFTPICTSLPTYQNGGQSGSSPTFCFPDATGINPNLPQGEQDPKHWFNPAAFANQKPFSFGNAGRNTIFAPGIIALDASLAKNFHFTERQKLEFRAEFFNVGNHPLFGYPGATIGTATFGVISTTIIDSRQLQAGLKYSF
jgi:hypothetical protein